MTRLYIYYWHGALTEAQVQKLIGMGMYEEKDVENMSAHYINMSIGEFADKWGEKFLAYPRNDTSIKGNNFEWLIGVTKHASFGQRG
jgi:hypothetical protein